ncbi:MAG: hypothetical protein Q7U06_02425, partial [Pseudomonadota bacterium]|nr:hypothetical protein [Pseudomonadota bacterium]
AILVQGGIMYNTASVEYDEDAYQTELQDQGTEAGSIPDPAQSIDADLGPSFIPVTFELRGHYNRLMVSFGSEFGFNTGGEDGKAQWIERFRTRGEPDAEVATMREVTVIDPISGEEESRYVATELLYNQVKINRNLYMGAAVVLGRDAGIGFGPRLGVRVGWTNVPYALQTTAHVGVTLAPPGIKPLGDRVRPFVDVDGRIGASFPFATSLAFKPKDVITVMPVFGLTAGVGTTF